MIMRISKLGLAAAITAMLAGTAFAGPLEMSLSSGTQSTGNFMVISGTSYVNSDLNGWNISYFIPTSNSPSTQPYGLNLSGFVAACLNTNGCGSLTLSISGTGFKTAVGMDGFGTGLVNNQMVTGETTGSIVQTAYYDLGDGYMGKADTIGTITLNGFGSQYVTGGGPASGTYSLTLVDQFSAGCTGSNCAVFGVDGSIGGVASTVPEPGTLALFGAGLLGCALAITRRRARQR